MPNPRRDRHFECNGLRTTVILMSSRDSGPDGVATRSNRLRLKSDEASSDHGVWKLPCLLSTSSRKAEGVHVAVVRADIHHPIRNDGRGCY